MDLSVLMYPFPLKTNNTQSSWRSVWYILSRRHDGFDAKLRPDERRSFVPEITGVVTNNIYATRRHMIKLESSGASKGTHAWYRVLILRLYWDASSRGQNTILTSWRGSAFRISGPLWGETHRSPRIPLTRDNNAEFFYVSVDINPNKLLN